MAPLEAQIPEQNFVRQAALSSATRKLVEVARVRRSVDEAERHLCAAREALG